ncbi:uncharacterized protein LOC108665219 [Hyalella azteca]|uniref:Uncharacterized protein LOC108665219 n=1 Tax=Hyalella azteca TaxID=294128 RepID=A0A8B7N0T9_HYAAZ|nr:uncharacterized protein LOC108665219 [Hyalella azteca]
MLKLPLKVSSGHTAHDLDAATQRRVSRHRPGDFQDVVMLQPGGWVMLRRYLKLHQKISSFQFRADDVVVMTFPKCGTTWCQEIVWNMRNNPNLDNPDADHALFIRSPFLEVDMLTRGSPTTDLTAPRRQAFFKGIEIYSVVPDFENGFMIEVLIHDESFHIYCIT